MFLHIPHDLLSHFEVLMFLPGQLIGHGSEKAVAISRNLQAPWKMFDIVWF
jgi:hypothetical protein